MVCSLYRAALALLVIEIRIVVVIAVLCFDDEWGNFTHPWGPESGLLCGPWGTRVGLGGLRYARVGSRLSAWD